MVEGDEHAGIAAESAVSASPTTAAAAAAAAAACASTAVGEREQQLRALGLLPILDDGRLPTAELEEIARIELGETPDVRSSTLAELRAALLSGKYVKLGEEEAALLTSDRFLLKFLRSRKFRVKEARKLLVNFFKWRREKPQYFEALDLSGPMMQRILRAGGMLLAPGVDALGRRMRALNMDAYMAMMMDRDDRLDGLWMVRYSVMMTLLMSEDAYLAVNGAVILFDSKNVGIGRILRWRNLVASQHNDTMTMDQRVLPIRLRGIYLVHQPRLFSIVFALIKPILSAKIRDRVRLYGNDLARLQADVPAHMLPESLGGAVSLDDAIAHTQEAARQSLGTVCQLAGIRMSAD